MEFDGATHTDTPPLQVDRCPKVGDLTTDSLTADSVYENMPNSRTSTATASEST